MTSLKNFCATEGFRRGMKSHSVYQQIRQGKYRLETKRVNARVIFVVKAWRVELKEVEL